MLFMSLNSIEQSQKQTECSAQSRWKFDFNYKSLFSLTHAACILILPQHKENDGTGLNELSIEMDENDQWSVCSG